MDDFVFTTEAHILPLTLALGNYSWHQPKVFTSQMKNKYVWGSDKSNEMSEKLKIEIALDYYCSVHDQFDTVSILQNDKFVYFL